MAVFLPWTSHFLPAVAAELILRHAEASDGSRDADLSAWTFVVRGGGANRRLTALLAAEAQGASRTLLPPRIVTLEGLPGALFDRPASVAGVIGQRLAWAAALDRSEDALLNEVWKNPAGLDRTASRRHLAKFLERTWHELSVSGTDFAGAFERLGRLMPEAADGAESRWAGLQQLLDEYRAVLDEWGLIEPAAWRQSLLTAGHATNHRVALIGVVELAPIFVSLLSILEPRPLIFIHAPESEKRGFDEWGRPVPAYWTHRGCKFENGEIHVVRGAREQATRCAELMRAWQEAGIPAQAITVAAPESAALLTLQHGIADAGIVTRAAGGMALSRSSPIVLVSQIADFLDRPEGEPATYESVAALARHPDLSLSTDFLIGKLDGFHEEHLPARMDRALWESESQESEVGFAMEQLEQLAVIRNSDFVNDVTELLLKTYGTRRLAPHIHEERTLAEALQSLRGTLDEMDALPAQAMAQFPPSDLLRLIADVAGSSGAPEPALLDAVEISGWLEAAADDAPALIITSVFDGSLPGGASTEPLLFDGLRESLGLPCRASRFARDQWTLHSAWMSRKNNGRFAIIAPRRAADGTAAKPSRLLLNAHENRALASRLLALIAEPAGKVMPMHRGIELHPPLPDPELMRRFRKFGVTAFRTYLASPRLFYFKYVLRLQMEEDSSEEIAGSAFGSAIHSVLEKFGTRHLGKMKNLTASAIARETTADLQGYIAERYGRHPLPPVAAQVHSLEERLRCFAEEQAALYAEGWSIVYAETGDPAMVPFVAPGIPEDVLIRGKIDRVDRHRDGTMRVIDYKTSATPKKPTPAHYATKREKWLDLQLPLYVRLLPALNLKGEIPEPGNGLDLHYFDLPPKADDAGISEPFDALLISPAWECAAAIVAEVCSGNGCQEVGDVSSYEDPVFHALCGLNGLPISTGASE